MVFGCHLHTSFAFNQHFSLLTNTRFNLLHVKIYLGFFFSRCNSAWKTSNINNIKDFSPIKLVICCGVFIIRVVIIIRVFIQITKERVLQHLIDQYQCKMQLTRGRSRLINKECAHWLNITIHNCINIVWKSYPALQDLRNIFKKLEIKLFVKNYISYI